MVNEKNYLAQAQALLPHGPAWTRDKDADLTKVLAAIATIFAEVDAKATNLAKEANPASTFELLADWERVCKLPDECAKCVSTPKTMAERRNDVINLLTSNFAPTAEYFQSVAVRLGYEIVVKELKPFICGLAKCGNRLNGLPVIRYDVFNVLVKGKRVALFRTGSARIGERLGSIRYAAELECVLDKLKPAHVNFIYGYE